MAKVSNTQVAISTAIERILLRSPKATSKQIRENPALKSFNSNTVRKLIGRARHALDVGPSPNSNKFQKHKFRLEDKAIKEGLKKTWDHSKWAGRPTGVILTKRKFNRFLKDAGPRQKYFIKVQYRDRDGKLRYMQSQIANKSDLERQISRLKSKIAKYKVQQVTDTELVFISRRRKAA